MIKNILFDFGGVLYDIDFSNTIHAFQQLGFNNFEELYSQYKASPVFQNLETGHISPGEFYTVIQQMAPLPVSHEQIRNAWNALLIGYRLPSLAFLLELRKNYQLLLLSNTNKIHYDFFTAQLTEQTNYPSLESFFTNAYFSQQIGLRKPDTGAFEYILNNAGIKAAETLFIDDSYTNFPNAEKLGMKIHLLEPGRLVENIDYKSFG